MNKNIRWAFNVKEWKPSKEQWKLCLRCVQKEEAERCNRFFYVNDCKASMVGRLLMRKAVSDSLGTDYNEIRFGRTESNKPFLASPAGNEIFFNVSHSGDFSVLASEPNNPVGIDVMKVEYVRKTPLSEFFNTMKKQFSNSEWNYISLPGLEIEQLQRFYRLWCLKESYVKATGTGIAYDLQTLSFLIKTFELKQEFITCDTQLYMNEIHQTDWIFEETLINCNHCVAVALNSGLDEDKCRNQKDMSFKILDFEELMKNCVPFEKEVEDFWNIYNAKKEKSI